MVEMVYGRYPLNRYSIQGRWLQQDGAWTPSRPHLGVDLGLPAQLGDTIYAIGPPGKIITHVPGDGWGDGSFGNCVILDHRGVPWYTLLAHMSALLAVTGEEFVEGDVIGQVGFSGYVIPQGPEGAHVHWQLSTDKDFARKAETTADPLIYVRAVAPPPPPPPLTLEQVLAQSLKARDEALAAMNEAKSINAAIQNRWLLEKLARDPDYPRVLSALDILRRNGMNL